MSSPGGTRISNRMDQDTTSGRRSNYFGDIQGGLSANGGTSREPSSKIGSSGGTSVQGPVHRSSFLVEGKDGSYQPVVNLKLLNTYLEGTLQDGNQGSFATRGLDVLPGPQGCIFDQRTSQVTPFSMGWQNFRIYLP